MESLTAAHLRSFNSATKVRARSKGRSLMGHSVLRPRVTLIPNFQASSTESTPIPTRRPTLGTKVEIQRQMLSHKDRWSTTQADFQMLLALSTSTIGRKLPTCLIKDKSRRSSLPSQTLSSTTTSWSVCVRSSTRNISQTISTT